jgi:hypothetical protein
VINVGYRFGHRMNIRKYGGGNLPDRRNLSAEIWSVAGAVWAASVWSHLRPRKVLRPPAPLRSWP